MSAKVRDTTIRAVNQRAVAQLHTTVEIMLEQIFCLVRIIENFLVNLLIVRIPVPRLPLARQNQVQTNVGIFLPKRNHNLRANGVKAKRAARFKRRNAELNQIFNRASYGEPNLVLRLPVKLPMTCEATSSHSFTLF